MEEALKKAIQDVPEGERAKKTVQVLFEVLKEQNELVPTSWINAKSGCFACGNRKRLEEYAEVDPETRIVSCQWAHYGCDKCGAFYKVIHKGGKPAGYKISTLK